MKLIEPAVAQEVGTATRRLEAIYKVRELSLPARGVCSGSSSPTGRLRWGIDSSIDHAPTLEQCLAHLQHARTSG